MAIIESEMISHLQQPSTAYLVKPRTITLTTKKAEQTGSAMGRKCSVKR